MAAIQAVQRQHLMEFNTQMMKKFITTILLGTATLLFSQGVGIGTRNPTQTLDVNGNMKLSGNLYFEDPGVLTGSSANTFLMVRDNSDQVLKRYIPATSEFGAINSTVYHITNISPSGITNFDTGIPTDQYYLVVGGFIVRGVNDNSNIAITQPGNMNQYIPQYSARSFEENGTWRIRMTPNNRVFDQRPEMRLSVSIYRRDMMTTVNNVINVNMNATTSGIGIAPAPVMP